MLREPTFSPATRVRLVTLEVNALSSIATAPFHVDTTDAYHMYFKRAEPEIVFGATGSGVENRPGADGRSFLDEVWDEGPFRNRAGLVLAVTRVADARVAAGSLTAAQRQAVLRAATRADLPS